MTPLRFVILFLPPLWLMAHVLGWRGLRWPLRLLAALALVLVSQAHAIDGWLFQSIAGPDMPAWLLMPQLWLYTAMLLLFCCTLFWDTLWLLRRLFRQAAVQTRADFAPDRRRILRRGGALALSLGASAVGMAQGLALPKVRELSLALPDLPPDLAGLRIAHLADLHIGPLTSREWVREVAALTMRLQPDLVCLSGDLSDGRPEYRAADGGSRARAFSELAALRAGYGVFACTGNHEYYSDYPGWMALYARSGIRVLHNEAVLLPRGAARLVLLGLDDRTGGRFGYPVATDVPALLAGLPGRADNACRLVMAHRPDTAMLHAQAGADMQLSGHTHGGQCLGMDRIVAHYNQGLVRGWYRVAGMPLYVSNGAGLWSGYPLRLGVPAEIELITLQRGQATVMPEL